MRFPKFQTFLFFLAPSLTAFSDEIPTETVSKFFVLKPGDSIRVASDKPAQSPHVISAGNFIHFSTRPNWGGPNQTDVDKYVATKTFTVYPKNSIDVLLNNEADARKTAISSSISELHKTIQLELIDSLNKLPGRLLSDSAKAEIENSILSKIESRISALESRLQMLKPEEIDKAKSSESGARKP